MTTSALSTIPGVSAQAPLAYNPKEHLVTISTKQGLKPYYPAAWRLYELRLRYPHASVEAEIVHLDPAGDLVIIKARIYDGPDYDMSQHKATALKQGSVRELDKVETKAKARAARDFGIGTEYALDFDQGDQAEDEDPLVVSTTLARSSVVEGTSESSPPPLDLAQVKERARAVKIAHNKATWQAFVLATLTQEVTDEQFTPAQLARLNGAIEQHKRAQSAATASAAK